MNFLDLSLNEKQINNIITDLKVIFSNGSYILGENLQKFESCICDYLGVKYCVGLNSGYDALYYALKALKIGRNDEVITVANTFIATVAAINNAGAKPVFVDVDETRNMNCDILEELITSKTKAILPVHLAGTPCNMDKLLNIAQKYNLYIIEDASQAFGSKYSEQFIGSFGDCGCFSLHPTKVLGACGDCGMVVTNDEEIYNKLCNIRNHGLVDRETCFEFGGNSRLDEIQACILNHKLKHINEDISKRVSIANVYNEKLAYINQLQIPFIPDNCFTTWFTYTIIAQKRDELKRFLESKGIDTRIHYPLSINEQKAYRDIYGSHDLPITDYQSKHIISLPCNSKIKISEAESICDYIKEFYVYE